jgi:hypothetical protein
MQVTPASLLNAPVSTQSLGSGSRAAAPRQGIEKVSGTPVFRLDHSGDDRINGSMPVWGKPASAKETVSQTLTDAALAQPETNALSLSSTPEAPAATDDSFGFLDLVDMINPLQHIPIISTVYRAVTGDTIKPISQIVGGAAFGGFIGAAGGIANAIVASETGKDIGENVMGFITGSGAGPAHAELPGTTIAMANLSYKAPHYNE